MDINPLLIPILGISCGLLAIFSGAIVRPLLKLKQRQMELNAQMVTEKAALYSAEKGRLEDRVEILERIITDQGYSLAQEIENLRSTPLPDSIPLQNREKTHEPL